MNSPNPVAKGPDEPSNGPEGVHDEPSNGPEGVPNAASPDNRVAADASASAAMETVQVDGPVDSGTVEEVADLDLSLHNDELGTADADLDTGNNTEAANSQVHGCARVSNVPPVTSVTAQHIDQPISVTNDKTPRVLSPVSPAFKERPDSPSNEVFAISPSPEPTGLQKIIKDLRAENHNLHLQILTERNQSAKALDQVKVILEEERAVAISQRQVLEKKVKDLEIQLHKLVLAEADRKREAEEALAAKEQRLDEVEALYNIQVTSGNEHLATVRADLTATQEKLMDVVKNNDDLRGDLAALRLKDEAGAEERRGLLERCVVGETRAAQLKETGKGLKKRVDDLEAALQEMARENQTLHLRNTKAVGRRWTEDNQVDTCSNCSASFSVILRRHHCRHCGNIFCFECSSKYAKVVSSRKPVRVCDPCYTEITKAS